MINSRIFPDINLLCYNHVVTEDVLLFSSRICAPLGIIGLYTSYIYIYICILYIYSQFITINSSHIRVIAPTQLSSSSHKSEQNHHVWYTKNTMFPGFSYVFVCRSGGPTQRQVDGLQREVHGFPGTPFSKHLGGVLPLEAEPFFVPGHPW